MTRGETFGGLWAKCLVLQASFVPRGETFVLWRTVFVVITGKKVWIVAKIRCTTGSNFRAMGRNFCIHYGAQFLYYGDEFVHCGENPLQSREQILCYGEKTSALWRTVLALQARTRGL